LSGPGTRGRVRATTRYVASKQQPARRPAQQKRLSAQQRLAAQRAEAARARQAAARRRRLLVTVGVPLAGVVAVVAVLIIVKVATGSGGPKSGQALSPADQALYAKYDAPPYVDSAGSIPFIDLAGRYVINGASYDPKVLQGKTHEQIATALSDPNSAIAKGADGTANLITAALCQATGDKPTPVCQSRGVTTATAALSGG
jgi:hypothetical protein